MSDPRSKRVTAVSPRTPRLHGQRTDRGAAVQSARDNIIRTTVKTKTWLELDGRFVIGDGGATLMLGILERGSLLAAAREIRWSYRHAWGYLKHAETVLGTPLTVSRSGRGPARGSLFTDTGRLVLERLLAIRNTLDDTLGPTGPTRTEIAARGRIRRGSSSARARHERGHARRGKPGRHAPGVTVRAGPRSSRRVEGGRPDGSKARTCISLGRVTRHLHAWRADRHAGHGEADDFWALAKQAVDEIGGDVPLDHVAVDQRRVAALKRAGHAQLLLDRREIRSRPRSSPGSRARAGARPTRCSTLRSATCARSRRVSQRPPRPARGRRPSPGPDLRRGIRVLSSASPAPPGRL